ncbi:CRISPR-associated autoregulator, DevR family [Ktedonobacter racemifer DSM 44963]|uniref:CRISPR-associated autoregulator, DevR family n=2 Tax=Ktedonobacter racemifer TaxID=363277 RepID=D6U5P7_KTERA|nr:CRISPR-associated autoregulator, DevR family [Ktedonobacter racemifer DSM 44963]
MPRRQLLADGIETDACSGNIAKHHHAALMAQYVEAMKLPLCPACKTRDGRRASILVNHPDYPVLSLERILTTCALCDAHGFLLTAKNASGGTEAETRQRLNKNSLLHFSYALALPEQNQMTAQTHTRSGSSKEEGQMIMKLPVRSGVYALHVRYQCVGVGADTEQWKLYVVDQQERRWRHQAVLHTLRDTLLSPEGALTATMLPHLTGLSGILVATTLGRAPIYSALQDDFVSRLQALQSNHVQVYPFADVNEFHTQMNHLVENSTPALPHIWHSSPDTEDAPQQKGREEEKETEQKK